MPLTPQDYMLYPMLSHDSIEAAPKALHRPSDGRLPHTTAGGQGDRRHAEDHLQNDLNS